MSKVWWTALEIAEAALPEMPETKRGVNIIADREQWRTKLAKDGTPLTRERKGYGGGWEYHISLLPEAARVELALRAQREAAEARAGSSPNGEQSPSTLTDSDGDGEQAPQSLRDSSPGGERGPSNGGKAQQRAEARAVILQACGQFLSDADLPVEQGLHVFAARYSAGDIPVPDWVRRIKPSVSRGSLRNWRKAAEREGLGRLAGNYGNRAGSGVIDRNPAMRDLVLGMLHQFPHASAAHVRDAIRARFDDGATELPSYRSVQRWLTEWKRANKQVIAKATNPDGWKNAYAAAAGSMSAKLSAPNELWELDSTKVDLILADGRRHTLIAAIDVYTRRFKLLVDRTSRAAGIAALLRHALLDWGVPTTVKTDNGADYVSQRIQGIFGMLGIEQSLCPPFSPEKKPHVERAFKTFLHDLVELLPGYVGHDVAEREAIRARESFAARLMTKPHSEDAHITLDSLSPKDLQDLCDRWCEDRYAHKAHGGLNGKTPFQVAAEYTGRLRRIEDERALDVLLAAPAEGDGWRTVRKKGLQVAGGWYDDPALGGYEGHRVRVLLDEADASHVYVFDAEGAFIAKAFAPEHAGLSQSELAAQRRARQRQVVNAGTKELRQSANRASVSDIGREILDGDSRRARGVKAFPKASDSHETPATREAGKAARAGETPKPAPISERERKAHEKVKADLSGDGEANLTPAERKERERHLRLTRAERVESAIAAGQPVDAAERAWFEEYRTFPEWKSYKALKEEFADFWGKTPAPSQAPDGTGQQKNGV
jgi:transposase InsO family protein